MLQLKLEPGTESSCNILGKLYEFDAQCVYIGGAGLWVTSLGEDVT